MHGTCCPSDWGVEEDFEVRGKGAHDDDCLWVIDYYPTVVNLDRKDADRSVNIVAHIGHPSCSCTGCSHRLINIGRHDICTIPLPSGVGYLTGNGLLRGRNRHPVAADPSTVDARHPYFGRVDDHLAESGRYGA